MLLTELLTKHKIIKVSVKAAVPGVNILLCLLHREPRGLCGALGQHKRTPKGLCPSAPQPTPPADKSLAKKSHTFWGYSLGVFLQFIISQGAAELTLLVISLGGSGRRN